MKEAKQMGVRGLSSYGFRMIDGSFLLVFLYVLFLQIWYLFYAMRKFFMIVPFFFL